jgi:8-oxo-dGTP pyrophosphatase MutT (NUDIX family)
VSAQRPSAAWRARLAADANAPPLRPRVPLSCGGERIGSVEPDLFRRAGLEGGSLLVHEGPQGWRLGEGDPTHVLSEIANTLRDTGLAHVWRNEQLAVRGEAGTVFGTIERGAVRALGIATQAVHLTALSPDGGIWVQQRALDKPTDPGLWDTLVGGLVPVGESLEEGLARESWEEAGLRPQQLRSLRAGGCIATRRPMRELAHGYIVEDLHWSSCVLADGARPSNQDGEVAAFACMPPEALCAALEREEFTIDAGLILLAAHFTRP